jgi:hypothetical protein
MTREIRLGLWGLVLAGVLIGVAWLLNPGGAPELAQDPDRYARALTSVQTVVVGTAAIVGLTFVVLGLLAVHALVKDSPAPSWAVAGPLVGVVAIALLLPVWGVLALAAPLVGEVYLGGHREAVEALKPLAGGSLPTRLIVYLIVPMLLALIGGVFTGVALWRSGRVPRWAAVIFAVGFICIYTSVPIVSLLGAVLVLISGAGMAVGQREQATRVRLATT